MTDFHFYVISVIVWQTVMYMELFGHSLSSPSDMSYNANYQQQSKPNTDINIQIGTSSILFPMQYHAKQKKHN